MDTSMNILKATGLPAAPAAPRPQAEASSAPVDGFEKGKPEAGQKAWTVLVYACSDNNLKSAILNNLKDMEKVGSNDQINVVSQFNYGGSVGAKRYYLIKGDRPGEELASPPVQSLGSTDMGSPKALSDFIQWGMKTYPAQHFMLVLNDHGGGWQGAMQDEGHNSWMTTPMLEDGLKSAREATGRKLDVLGFDACLMGDTEVAHQLQPEADFMVGSQETEGAYGWGYSHILSADSMKHMQATLRSRMKMDPKELAQDLVKQAQSTQDDLPTMSAYDMTQIPDLVKKTDALAAAIAASPGTADQFATIAGNTQAFTTQADLGDFAARIIKSDIADDKLKQAATDVQAAIKNAVMVEQHSSRYPDATGVSIELGSPGGDYNELKFAKDTKWKDAQAKIASGQNTSPAPAPEPSDPWGGDDFGLVTR